jgi:signal transduction histidine kinase
MNRSQHQQASLTRQNNWYSAIGHDLRHVVHLIQHSLESLVKLSSGAGNADVQSAVNGIRFCCRTMDLMLSQLLDLSRLEEGAVQARLTAVEMTPLLGGLITQFSARAEAAGVRLVQLGTQAGSIFADELLLHRVIGNLLENAIAASYAGGTVVLASHRTRYRWRIQVRDSGIGMPTQDQARIANGCEQSLGMSRGPNDRVGLGLAISRRLTLLMHGDIEVHSSRGCGCCVTVTLPRFSYSSSDMHSQRDNHV